jgi:SNF2 family DNA or RNA helicase
MPGFLGSLETFNRWYRHPIEQEGDAARLEHLRRRIRPFLLRRTKAEVVAELPPKTEIVQTVTLGEKQAKVYEAIRLTMQERVRRALAEKGLARSQITVLDALLKLRQVCCDPTLVDLPQARQVKESAKLDWLRETLPELVEEGRRILVFSQFVQMLERIEPVLAEQKITYVKLTGSTRRRDEVIDRFRRGDAPVFLISLKAGGVGLNLTEADTVILFDPWWNPAVEEQAIDRTHRIGQDKPVFVYKLIAANTVEEKMLEMQARKRSLAEGTLETGEAGGFALTEEDVAALLSSSPLEI